VNDPAGVNYRIATQTPGSSVELVIRKAGGAEHTLNVRLERPPGEPPRDERTIAGANPLNGATVINLSPAAASDLGLDPFAGQGVVITAINAGYAGNLGLRPGDFIREVNGTKIETTAQLEQVLGVAAQTWTLVIERGGQTITAQVRV
jgi:S1-C subfamily serine protease